MWMASRIEAMALADIAAGRDPGGKAKYIGTTRKGSRGPIWTGKVNFDPKMLLIPLKRKKPTTYFVNSESDLFHETVPDEWIDQAFAVMAATPKHTYQVLTKRPDRMAAYLQMVAGEKDMQRWINQAVIQTNSPCVSGIIEEAGWPLPNVWLGTSIEDQATADERVPHLLRCDADIRFLSYEPALGPVDFDMGRCEIHDREFIHHGEYGECCGECAADGFIGELTYGMWLDGCARENGSGIGWVIVGGESGPHARPFDISWALSTVTQCAEEGVPCFVKQLGAQPLLPREGDMAVHMMLRDSKGGDPSEWPEALRVRQYPTREPAHA
jgi:protein gp37